MRNSTLRQIATELPEFDCENLESAWVHFGRIALAFDSVVLLLSPECATRLGEALRSLIGLVPRGTAPEIAPRAKFRDNEGSAT